MQSQSGTVVGKGIAQANHTRVRTGRPSTAGPVRQAKPYGSVMTLANMWQRIPGDVAIKIRRATPMNYAVLELPDLGQFGERMRGLRGIQHLVENRDPTLAKWRKVPFATNMDSPAALTAVEEANRSNERAVKFKLTFSNGMQVTLSRRDQTDADSLVCTSCYEPNRAFNNRTGAEAAQSRAVQQKKMEFICNDKGHITRRPKSASLGRPVSPFAPEKLYAEVPAPELQQPGYAFQPMSHISYLQRPNSVITGVRPGLRETNPRAIHFRPRSYCRPHSTVANRYAMENVEASVGRLRDPIDGRNSQTPLRARSATGRPTSAPAVRAA